MLSPSYVQGSDSPRETRTPVRLPDRRDSQLFPGWGPKF